MKEWQNRGNGPFLFKKFAWYFGVKSQSEVKQMQLGHFPYGHSIPTQKILHRVSCLLAKLSCVEVLGSEKFLISSSLSRPSPDHGAVTSVKWLDPFSNLLFFFFPSFLLLKIHNVRVISWQSIG